LPHISDYFQGAEVNHPTDRRRPRLQAHRISPLPVALGVGVGLLASGAVQAAAVANNDSFTVVDRKIDQNVGNVLTNDTGTAPLQATGLSLRNGIYGTANVLSDGTFQYFPHRCAAGRSDSFTYTMRDGSATFANAVATVTLISPLVNDSYTTNAGTAVSGDVRDNDLPAGNTLPVTNFTLAGNGTVVGDVSGASTNGQFTYTPNLGFSGIDNFVYSAFDPALGCSPPNAAVQVMVLPVATPDTFATAFATSLSGDVLSNDLGTGLTVTGSTPPAHGTANVAADGSFVYVPAPGFSGSDSFTYTIQDSSGDGATVTGAVSITVGAAPPTPTPATTPAALGLLATLLAWLGLRRRRET
jgi:hypothetical protein